MLRVCGPHNVPFTERTAQPTRFLRVTNQGDAGDSIPGLVETVTVATTNIQYLSFDAVGSANKFADGEACWVSRIRADVPLQATNQAQLAVGTRDVGDFASLVANWNWRHAVDKREFVVGLPLSATGYLITTARKRVSQTTVQTFTQQEGRWDRFHLSVCRGAKDTEQKATCFSHDPDMFEPGIRVTAIKGSGRIVVCDTLQEIELRQTHAWLREGQFVELPGSPGVAGLGTDFVYVVERSLRAKALTPDKEALLQSLRAREKEQGCKIMNKVTSCQPLCDTQLQPGSVEFETEFVHGVYDKIAPHFSSTRYKAWPRIASFLLSLPTGSVVADIGCGNGKYAYCNPHIFWLGADRCMGLLRTPPPLSSSHAVEKFCGDCLATGLRSGVADACLSIAVLHHLSSKERRRAGLAEAVRIVRPGGKVLVYLWAFEQQSDSIGSRQFASSDCLVPWSLCATENKTNAQFQRYYHVFTRDEAVELCADVPGVDILTVDYDSNNWACLLQKHQVSLDAKT